MQYDLIVIGSGIAGLATALAAAPLRVALLSSGDLGQDGASRWAQGGIAAALGPGDSAAIHARDTCVAGNQLNNAAAVQALTGAAAAAVHWLDACGVRFDRDAAGYALGREAAHTHKRIVHAQGDATGAAVMTALAVQARAAAWIQPLQRHRVVQLLGADGRIAGVVADSPRGRVQLHAPAVVLATGGIGALYRHTTNPVTADASGLALALQAGAQAADLEFVQFHPTALRLDAVQQGQLPLLTEALRGAGAVLVNGSGRRFLAAQTRDAELAPRDIVARAVWRELERGERVYLDASAVLGADFPQRFPTVYASCRASGIDPRRDPMPVVPAQHYHMGGLRVDATAATSVAGLHAVGEVACSGVHGANRLASNSLLEGLVFGQALGRRLAALPRVAPAYGVHVVADVSGEIAPSLAESVRDTLWREAGLVRDAAGLQRAQQQLQALDTRTPAERARVDVARRLVAAALARRDSVGAHYRADAAQVRAG